MRVSGIPSVAQRWTMGIGCPRNFAIAAQPLNDSSGFFCLGMLGPGFTVPEAATLARILQTNKSEAILTDKSHFATTVLKHLLD